MDTPLRVFENYVVIQQWKIRRYVFYGEFFEIITQTKICYSAFYYHYMPENTQEHFLEIFIRPESSGEEYN